jgi:hypothetical protein
VTESSGAERLRLVQETHRLLHYVYGDAARQLGHLALPPGPPGDRPTADGEPGPSTNPP